MRLTPRITASNELSEAEISELLTLFQRYYEFEGAGTFRSDLRAKNLIVRLYDEQGVIHGFSTMAGYARRLGDRRVGVIYSGDTIVEPDCWGTTALPRGWLEAVSLLASTLPRPLYWMLISSGYKTYRFLAVFFREFFPSCLKAPPSEVRAMMDELAALQFGDQYDAQRGIVRFRQGTTALRRGIADLDEHRMSDPHVAYFAERNPGFDQGEELVCLAEIAVENITAAGRRIVDATGISLV